jgi:DNA-binding YbaB/EbfC family protein
MFDQMKQLYELQKKAKEAQKTLDALKCQKTSKDGKIQVTLNGNFKVESLSIDSSLLNPDQKSHIEKTLADLITDAAQDVQKQAASQAMGMMKGMNLKIPGM